jgi:hypothetical protein
MNTRLLQKADKDILRGDDGYFVYWPTENLGAYSSSHLREIADELDRRNKPWDDFITEYFEQLDSVGELSPLDSASDSVTAIFDVVEN